MKKGFSLVELLVVVSIISILAAVGIGVFSSIQKTNRDQQRLRDLNTIKQSLELYRSDKNSYPGALSDLSLDYLDPQPLDPSFNRPYQFQKSPASCQTANYNCTGFLLCAKGEGSSSFTLAQECIDTDLDCGGTSGDCNMGVSSD